MMTRLFAACAVVGSILAVLPTAAQTPAADTPAVAAVRQFLTDRAAGQYSAAYALLSPQFQQKMTLGLFTAGNPPPPAKYKEMPEPVIDLSLLFGDTHNTRGCTFTVVGPDPASPAVVLVRAVRPGVPAATLHVVTVGAATAPALRLDVYESMVQSQTIDYAKISRQMQSSAQRTSSQSNLLQLGLGMLQYEQDHDERLPDAAKWVDEIMPYVKSLKVFHDPAAPATQAYSYAYNRALSHQSGDSLKDDAQTVMAFESTAGVKNAADTGQSVPVPGRHPGPGGQHTGTDYLFADGHVKWLPDGMKPSFNLSGK